MNVLTLTTKEQVEKYSSSSYKLLLEGKYDKVVFKGITDLSGYTYLSHNGPYSSTYLECVPEIEVQNCTMEDMIRISNVKTPLKITIKDSTIQDLYIRDVHTSISLVMNNVTSGNMYIAIQPDSGYTGGKSSLVFKNSKLKIQQLSYLDDTCDVELSNNHDTILNDLSLKLIPDNAAKQSAFLSQFSSLCTTTIPSKIDEFNYQFDQTDWDKLILLLDRYPDLFQRIKFNESFTTLLSRSTNDIYIHIPSTSFPLGWIDGLDAKASSPLTHEYMTLTAKDCAWFYVNKNNGHNFTITHIDQFDNWSSPYYLKGFLIADNYKDIIEAHVGNGLFGTHNTMGFAYYPSLSFNNILSGKMVTSEITLLPNTYFLIRTINSDMKIKSIKEVTGFHGKTIKVTGMEPFMLLSVAGTKCHDIDGVVEVDRTGSEAFIDGSITVKLLSTVDIDGSIAIRQEIRTDIIGEVAINRVESFIDGDVSIKAVIEAIMDGTVSDAVPSPEAGIDGDIIIAGIEKIITGTVNVQPIVSITVTGEIAVNLIDYDLDGSFQLAQAVSADIIGDIDVRVCRVEILGYFEIPMEEVWG